MEDVSSPSNESGQSGTSYHLGYTPMLKNHRMKRQYDKREEQNAGRPSLSGRVERRDNVRLPPAFMSYEPSPSRKHIGQKIMNCKRRYFPRQSLPLQTESPNRAIMGPNPLQHMSDSPTNYSRQPLASSTPAPRSPLASSTPAQYRVIASTIARPTPRREACSGVHA
jgi:hypothetical protein